MRVVNPDHHNKPKAKPRKLKRGKKPIIIIMVAFILIALLAIFWPAKSANAPTENSQQQKQSNQITPAPEPPKPKQLKTFTGEQFKNLYESFAYPNTEKITESLSITGNAEADKRIRMLAEARGYKVRSIPVAPIKKIGDPNLGSDDLLQSRALEAWRVLQANAKKDGIDIRILSAYRSPELQRSIFRDRLNATGATADQIASGNADSAVNSVLITSSVPGYSRHHTGYTVDFQCGSGTLEAFESSACFNWISKNNYEKAKIAGWIPSYPEGAGKQGPDPEPWEYVWVGTDVVYQ